jgi:hypothetical protein
MFEIKYTDCETMGYSNGSHFVAGASKTDPSKPDKANKGRFIKFYPGGKRK